MKYIKYIAAAILLTAGLASCEAGEGSGTPGKTTVQFAQAVVEEGFGAGVVRVPLTIVADNKSDMNSCSVQAKVKIVTTGDANEGTPDLDGRSGDYRVTSLDVNFPAFNNYYDEKNPEEYKDENGKWVKTVYMEVYILNDEPETMNFTFEIESATTTIGEQNQCKVVLAKGIRDRMCGNYALTCNELSSATNASVVWDGDYKCFAIEIPAVAAGMYLYTYFDDVNECMVAYPYEPIAYASQNGTLVWYTSFYTNWEEKVFADDYIIITFDVDAGTLTFPEDVGFIFAVYSCDESMNPVEYAGRINTMEAPLTGIVMTKK